MAKAKRVRQVKRALTKNERVEVRSATGRFKKYRSDTKLILYVRNKKTGKLIGTLNHVEKGVPTPRRFSGGQFTLLTKPRVQAGYQVQEKGEMFRIYSHQMIVAQIPNDLPKNIRRLAIISDMGTVIVSFEIFHKDDFHIYTEGTVFDGNESLANTRIMLAKMIQLALYNISVRISAKVRSPQPKNKLRRYVDVIPLFS